MPRPLPRAWLLVAALAVTAQQAVACTSDLNCSLNGVCTGGKCVCDRPWKGSSCEQMGFNATTRASGKTLYPLSDPRNTWNGPIVQSPDGKYHLYCPLYNVGSLGGPPTIKHGVANSVTGPYNWTSQPDICSQCGENPAMVVANSSSNNPVYTLWVGGSIWTASSAYGPFSKMVGVRYPSNNPAPVHYNGAWYMTNQKTLEIYTTPRLGEPWTVFANVSHEDVPENWMIEDPFLWIDQRGSWHIVNHAYNNYEFSSCGSSLVSAHFFSANGKDWHNLGLEPYGHTVRYDDGTSHTYTTLERPNIHFDAAGQMTHINLAADMVTGDEGCANRTEHSHFGHCPCDNCKWADHAGTTIIALDV